MKINLDDLEKKAREATPGPWTWSVDECDEPTYLWGQSSNRDSGLVLSFEGHDSIRPENAAHMASASPDVVLALISYVRALEAAALVAAKDLEDWVDGESQYPDHQQDPSMKHAKMMRALVAEGASS